ncbi:putative TPR domain protein [Nautilia profundicola AmH]|uniref:TPR domain protein n=1 Tax=Nautilia profundicola (strain ATCC BAA-1463 / DSM 18972 / AmH) TaxID=598659 RepID=B9L909_NAUPA|nr:tetratricopeptide repeat protein [Nautilia profundicola]ACM93250.1 putative TPR domain protein [Nautilia profundicola AmH]
MKKLILIISITLSLFGLDIKKAYYESYNYEKMGDYKDAIKVLIPVYNKYPNGYTLNLRLGWLFYLSKKYQNALDHYKKASLVAPYSIEAKLGIMRTYLAAGDYDNALKVGDVILKIDYYNYYGNYYEIVCLIAKKEYKTALSLTNKMLSLYPTSVIFLVQLGKIYYVSDKTKAKKIFEDVLILDPNNIIAKEYLNK